MNKDTYDYMKKTGNYVSVGEDMDLDEFLDYTIRGLADIDYNFTKYQYMRERNKEEWRRRKYETR